MIPEPEEKEELSTESDPLERPVYEPDDVQEKKKRIHESDGA